MEDNPDCSVEINLGRKRNLINSQNPRVLEFVENVGDYGSPVPESDDMKYNFFAKVCPLFFCLWFNSFMLSCLYSFRNLQSRNIPLICIRSILQIIYFHLHFFKTIYLFDFKRSVILSASCSFYQMFLLPQSLHTL